MSLLATAVLIGFLLVSAAMILRSRRPESDRPSAIMLQLMDAADELERRESASQPSNPGARSENDLKHSSIDRTRKNSPLAPVASR